MVFNVTFKNISVISWWSVLLLEETEVQRRKPRPDTNHYSNGIDYNNVCKRSFFIEFGYRTQMEKKGADWFGFTDLVYKNINLDVAILKLLPRKGKSYPPPINMSNGRESSFDCQYPYNHFHRECQWKWPIP
jgi:hypothetical protein